MMVVRWVSFLGLHIFRGYVYVKLGLPAPLFGLTKKQCFLAAEILLWSLEAALKFGPICSRAWVCCFPRARWKN